MAEVGRCRGGSLLEEQQPALSEAEELRMVAEAWQEGSGGLPNRLFLSMFAIYLVKHFRAEEDQLDRTNAPDRNSHRHEHHRLVQQLRNLMSDTEFGLEVTRGIQTFLEDWRHHQEGVRFHLARGTHLGH
jgi:hypothetical protein